MSIETESDFNPRNSSTFSFSCYVIDHSVLHTGGRLVVKKESFDGQEGFRKEGRKKEGEREGIIYVLEGKYFKCKRTNRPR